MKTILDNAGNQKAFNKCKNEILGMRRVSFSVYAYMNNGNYSFGPAFYVGVASYYGLPKPGESRAVARIRVYPKA